jgi:hypothetical protein
MYSLRDFLRKASVARINTHTRGDRKTPKNFDNAKNINGFSTNIIRSL